MYTIIMAEIFCVTLLQAKIRLQANGGVCAPLNYVITETQTRELNHLQSTEISH